MTPDPFPNELVEAAAKALLGSGPLPTTWDESWEELPKHQRKELRSAGAAVLAAVLPLIEQRVIDRLAREAGEPPYEEWNPTRAVWLEAVACGVAAERARCPLCDHEWRRHDPVDGMCDCHDETAIGPCRCGRDLAWVQERIAAMSSAALAPERTGEGA